MAAALILGSVLRNTSLRSSRAPGATPSDGASAWASVSPQPTVSDEATTILVSCGKAELLDWR